MRVPAHLPPHYRKHATPEPDMQAFVEARYDYHWAPLLGCLVGHLEHIGISQPSSTIGSVTGISYQPPQDAELPVTLRDGLAALGASSQITNLTFPNRLQRYRARRHLRSELRANRPVTTYGVGVSAFGPAWGLIVGVDDERRAWRRDGPMTEQVSPWLAETEFNALPTLILIAARKLNAARKARKVSGTDEPAPDRVVEVAAEAFARSKERARGDLGDRIALLDSSIEIPPQRYAHEAQTLAANWGEAATFWREMSHPEITPIAQQMAVTLSRYATLFPYPMGGQPNHPGVRNAAVRVLSEARTLV